MTSRSVNDADVDLLQYLLHLGATTTTTLYPTYLQLGVVPSRGAVCAVVAIRDRVFRLELTFSQLYSTRGPPGAEAHTLIGKPQVFFMQATL